MRQPLAVLEGDDLIVPEIGISLSRRERRLADGTRAITAPEHISAYSGGSGFACWLKG